MVSVESAVLLSYFLAKTTAVESEKRDDLLTSRQELKPWGSHAAMSELANATDNFQDEVSRQKGLEEKWCSCALVLCIKRVLNDGAPQQVRR
jgi:hypothetical protein